MDNIDKLSFVVHTIWIVAEEALKYSVDFSFCERIYVLKRDQADMQSKCSEFNFQFPAVYLCEYVIYQCYQVPTLSINISKCFTQPANAHSWLWFFLHTGSRCINHNQIIVDVQLQYAPDTHSVAAQWMISYYHWGHGVNAIPQTDRHLCETN